MDKTYLPTFLKNRSAEYRQLMKERGIEVADESAAVPVQPVAVKSAQPAAPTPAPKVSSIATSKLRNNLLHEYEDGYEYAEAYIHLLQNHKYKMEKTDNYQEDAYMLTLAVHAAEVDGSSSWYTTTLPYARSLWGESWTRRKERCTTGITVPRWCSPAL